MSVNEKMTAIANAIRSKTGKTGSLTLDSMATEINSIETGSSGGNIETCTVTIGAESRAFQPTNIAYTSVDTNGNIIGISQTVSNVYSVTITCAINSILAVQYKRLGFNQQTSNASLLFEDSTCIIYKLDNNATTAEILNSDSLGPGDVND